MPLPPGMIPSATSGWQKTDEGVAKRMSHPRANSEPPPPTRPSIRAMVGFGIVRRVSHMAWKPFGTGSSGISVGKPRIASTSKWAMNHSGSAERKTTARTASSAARAETVVARSRNIAVVIRLIGSFEMTTSATPRSSTATSTVLIADAPTRA